ncbi:hypothetical protein EGW08_004551, partial [Elysia chlorotica]
HYIWKIVLLSATVSCIIFCTGWVFLNSYYYSAHKTINWFMIVVGSLVVTTFLIEPILFLSCAIMSKYLWRKHFMIGDCEKRFLSVSKEFEYKQWMVDAKLVLPHRTSFCHRQAAPESVSMFYLHHMIHKALEHVIEKASATFQNAVYWLILYIICALILVNLQSDTYNCNSQKNYLMDALSMPVVD